MFKVYIHTFMFECSQFTHYNFYLTYYHSKGKDIAVNRTGMENIGQSRRLWQKRDLDSAHGLSSVSSNAHMESPNTNHRKTL